MSPTPDRDVVVVGAGFAGLYAVHRLRNLLGLDVQAFEAAAGPGGTWWWNRYPGARCDFESSNYSYSFDEELQQEWRWSERFSAQPEILSYLEHVAERFDLRRSIRFGTRVTSAVWDDDAKHWAIGTDNGKTTTATYFVTGSGNVSVAKRPEFPGAETFGGELYKTYDWPHEDVDLAGKRVGVIGTGASGIQVIPEVAKVASHLTVFQRTPNFAAPLGNRPTDPAEEREILENYPALRVASRNNFLGAPYEAPQGPALAATPEERRATYDRYWASGGFRLVVSTYQDLLFDKAANDTIATFIHEKIRERVADPGVAALLCPTDHPYATKRAPFETEYYEAYNRPNVELVDVRAAPIQEITATGVRTSEGEYELDVIIMATGFDAFTGPLLALGIVGRDGLTLEDAWKDGPRSYLGVGVHGFPNLFTITGPQSAVGLYNNPLAIEDHVEWTADAIQALRASGQTTIEPTAEAQETWNGVVNGIVDLTLLPLANSWYMGANIPGKPRQVLFFAGGAPLYRAICAEAQALGYAGFARDGEVRELGSLVHVDPAILLLVGAMLAQGVKPMEEQSVEEVRAALDGFTALQAPRRELPEVVETSFPGPADARPVRIYKPSLDAGPLPVVVHFHPGGWVGGGLEIADEPCRALADDLGALVVSVGYRLAPEHPFPAATEDTYAAVKWVAETIAEHGGDPARIVVSGESSGAYLAALAAQRVRDEGGPELLAQVLIYPPIAPGGDSGSRRLYAQGPILSAAAGDGMFAAYLNGTDPGAPLASPANGALEGLPPALVLSVECDPLRDGAEGYARALADAGVDTTAIRVDGLVHASFSMSGVVPRAQELRDAISAFLAPRLAAAERPAATA